MHARFIIWFLPALSNKIWDYKNAVLILRNKRGAEIGLTQDASGDRAAARFGRLHDPSSMAAAKR